MTRAPKFAVVLCAAAAAACGLHDPGKIAGVRTPVGLHATTQRDYAIAEFARALLDPQVCLKIPADHGDVGPPTDGPPGYGSWETTVVVMRSTCINTFAQSHALGDAGLCDYVRQTASLMFRSGNGSAEWCRSQAAQFRPDADIPGNIGMDNWSSPRSLGLLNLAAQDFRGICDEVNAHVKVTAGASSPRLPASLKFCVMPIADANADARNSPWEFYARAFLRSTYGRQFIPRLVAKIPVS